MARYECIKKNRLPAQTRFGSLVERMFGATNTQFVHNLLGNTRITRNVRQVPKSVNPLLSRGPTIVLRTAIDEAISHFGPVVRARNELGQFV